MIQSKIADLEKISTDPSASTTESETTPDNKVSLKSLQSEFQALSANSETSAKDKIESLFQFYSTQMNEFHKQLYKDSISINLQAQVEDFKVGVYEKRAKQSSLVQNKFEVITREY